MTSSRKFPEWGGGRAEDPALHCGIGILRSLPGSFFGGWGWGVWGVGGNELTLPIRSDLTEHPYVSWVRDGEKGGEEVFEDLLVQTT